MPTERELKTTQEDRLFDILMLMGAGEQEKAELLDMMAARAKSGMSKEEIAEVQARVSEVRAKKNK